MTEAAPDPGARTRALAARAIGRVLAAGCTLDEALRTIDYGTLSAADRAQVRFLAFGAVRWHHRHRALLGRLLDRPLSRGAQLLEALLSVGMYQLLDETQPDHAAVSATVEAARILGLPRTTGLVNATLRRLQRERAGFLAAIGIKPEQCYSHPAWLIEHLRRAWPADWLGILAANQMSPPLWLRVNLQRISIEGYCEHLAALGLRHRRDPALPGAVCLETALPVDDIPGFLQGEVPVQDAAAQLAAGLLDVHPGLRVLDACAAPGGKSTHLLELGGGQIELLALDTDALRLSRVAENLERLGLVATLRVADALHPATWWDGRPFDRILVDAPCSGTGVIRRHPDIKLLRRETDVAPLAARQRALLDALWPLLAPGGRLLYATCSVLPDEGAGVFDGFCGANAAARPVAAPVALPGWARPVPGGGWQVLPGPAGTDGFYYGLMTRNEV